MVADRQGESSDRARCALRRMLRILQRDRPAIRVDGLLREQRLRAVRQRMDSPVQPPVAQPGGRLRQEMGADSRAWLGDARQPVCHADTADRRRRSGAASMAVAVMASAVAAAYGCDDHRTGQQFRTAYASDRIRVRIPVPGVLARVACRAACRTRGIVRWHVDGGQTAYRRAPNRQTAVRQAGRRRTISRWTTA